MMHVGDMRMLVRQTRVPVGVGMGFAWWIVRQVRMLMMLVMHVRMLVLQRLVDMLMLVMLGQMQPHADGHQ